MKKCVVVSDSFKGTLPSVEICQIARSTIPQFFPDCQVVTIPTADGGEGTVACFIEAAQALPIEVEVSGPYWGETVHAVYARMGTKAVIEMSSAAGLPLVGKRRNPEKATTFGVGEIIEHAIKHGCTQILLGLGGSATNDGGCGCAAALGARFYQENGKEFVPTGGTLKDIRHIDLSDLRHRLQGVQVVAMCDVDTPLYGAQGAAHVFAPQKGADPAMVERLDFGLSTLDGVFQKELGYSLATIPGGGAAGGMGAGCVAFFNAELKSGIEAILDLVGFDCILNGADLVITGEGRIDGQSVRGKVISGVARRTSARNVPLIAIVGAIAEGAQAAYELGVTAMFGIDREAVSFDQYAQESGKNYQETLADIMRLIRALEKGRDHP